MKQKAFLLKSLMVIGLLGCTVSVYAQSYEVDRGRVFFERKPIPYADARTFVDLGCGYGKDCEMYISMVECWSMSILLLSVLRVILSRIIVNQWNTAITTDAMMAITNQTLMFTMMEKR